MGCWCTDEEFCKCTDQEFYNKKIEMGKKYKTKDGRSVRILCTDGPVKTHPVIGIIEGDIWITRWSPEGKTDYEALDFVLKMRRDLVEVKEKKVMYTILYFDEIGRSPTTGKFFSSKEEILEHLKSKVYTTYPTIATVTWEE